MSTVHTLLITNNNLKVLPTTIESLQNNGLSFTILDIGSQDGTQQWAEENGYPLLKGTPSRLSELANEFFANLKSDFMFVMYGNELLKGDVLGQSSAVPASVSVVALNARAPEWVNDVLARNDFFLEARLFRAHLKTSFIGTSRIYPLFEPEMEVVSLTVFIDRHPNGTFNLNSEQLYEQIANGALSLSRLQSLHRVCLEEITHIARNVKLKDKMLNAWKAAQENLDGIANGVLVLYAMSLLELDDYDTFEQVIKSTLDANEAGQGSVHATYAMLLESAYMNIVRSERQRVLGMIEVQAKRLEGLSDDDFAEDALPGTNKEKSDHICCVTAIRQEKNDLASELVERLQLGGLAGLEIKLLGIECMQNNFNGEALQESLSELEPMLKNHCYSDAWLLSACGCVLMGNLQDIENLWNPAYFQSRMGFVSPHRRHVLSGMFSMISMLSGKPIEGHGAYGSMGALMRRRPLTGVVTIPMSVIERSVNAMLLHNNLHYLTPLFERRAEALVPGIKDFVISHLSTLGFPVEDDGEPQPIFILGDHHGIFQACFKNTENFNIVSKVCTPTSEIEDIWDALTDAREKEFDAFSWLDADDGESEEDLVERVRSSCRSLISAQQTNKDVRIVETEVTPDQLEIFTEGLIDGTALVVIEDPRDYAHRNGANDESSILRSLLKWERNIVQIRKILSEKNYRYIETTPWLMLRDPFKEMSRIAAGVGEPIPVEQFDLIKSRLSDFKNKEKPSNDLISAVNQHGEQQLRRFGFPL